MFEPPFDGRLKIVAPSGAAVSRVHRFEALIRRSMMLGIVEIIPALTEQAGAKGVDAPVASTNSAEIISG